MLPTKRQRVQTRAKSLTISVRIHEGRLKAFASGIFVTLACLCLSTLLLACGTNSATTTGAGATPTKVVARQCGTVHTTPRGIIADTSAAKTAEDCFVQDYKQCHPATLSFTLLSVDSGINRTFTVKSANGKCTITDAVQHYVVPRQPGPAQVYTCTGVTQEADGLHFSSCGQDGDVVVPDTSTPINA